MGCRLLLVEGDEIVKVGLLIDVNEIMVDVFLDLVFFVLMDFWLLLDVR